MELNDFKRNLITGFIPAIAILCALSSMAYAGTNQQSACYAELINRIESVTAKSNGAKARSLIKASVLEGPLKSKKYGLNDFYRYLVVVSLMRKDDQFEEYYKYDVDCILNKESVIGIELHFG